MVSVSSLFIFIHPRPKPHSQRIYNFIKIHRTLRVTPAMAAGVTDRLWDVEDLVSAWEASERRLERQAA